MPWGLGTKNNNNNNNNIDEAICMSVAAEESCADEMDGARVTGLQHLHNEQWRVSFTFCRQFVML